ncbi:hypothetical protein BHM03_00032602 [Ensete ventricosum]|nr:hypothetical protein BHM03_00032602 [Ensete ventricosum]
MLIEDGSQGDLDHEAATRWRKKMVAVTSASERTLLVVFNLLLAAIKEVGGERSLLVAFVSQEIVVGYDQGGCQREIAAGNVVRVMSIPTVDVSAPIINIWPQFGVDDIMVMRAIVSLATIVGLAGCNTSDKTYLSLETRM